MATAAAYASTPLIAVGQVTTANTARDGTGTIVTIATGAAAGTRIEDISIKAIATTTAGTIRFFISTDSGTTNRLWKEVPVTAITASASVAAWSYDLTDLALLLPNNTTMLRASTEVAATFNIIVTRAGSF